MYYEYLSSPIGTLKISADENKIMAIDIVEKTQTPNENGITRECKKQLKGYFKKRQKDFFIEVDISKGTPFQQRVWSELRKIPYGTTVSYKELAERVGNIRAVRAVANAVGKNPFLVILPCHRVIASNGKIGGFSVGIDKKIILLEHEGIII